MPQPSDDWTIDFIGIGAAKCGTTWLAKCLGEHPDICFSSPKETHLFNRPHESKNAAISYQQFFTCDTDTQLRGELTPNYYLTERIAIEIAAQFPACKLIVALRNPVDRAWSHYQYQKTRTGTYTTFADCFAHDTRCAPDGLYYKHLSALLKHVPRAQVLFLKYEDSKTDPAAYVRHVYEFLGVDTTFIPSGLTKRFNATKDIQIKRRWLFRLFGLRKKLKKHRLGRVSISLLTALGVKSIIRTVEQKNTVTTPVAAKEIMPAAERNKALEYYRSDILELATLTGLDLTDWFSIPDDTTMSQT